jgi:hypothetical protein
MGVATSQAQSKSLFQRSQISATGLVLGGDLRKLTLSPRFGDWQLLNQGGAMEDLIARPTLSKV